MEPKWNCINNNNTKRKRGREGKTNKTRARGKTGGAMIQPYEEERLCPRVNIGFADIVFMNEATDKRG